MWRARLSTRVRELRLHVSPRAPSSLGARKWIQNRYPFTKQLNPRLPILIREGHNTPPVLIAKYDFGKEKTYAIADKSMEQIDGYLEDIYKAGADMPRSNGGHGDLDVVDDFHYALYKKGPVRVSVDKY